MISEERVSVSLYWKNLMKLDLQLWNIWELPLDLLNSYLSFGEKMVINQFTWDKQSTTSQLNIQESC